MSSGRRIAVWLLAAVAVGLTVFGLMAWQAVTVLQIDAPAALREFDAVRTSVHGAPIVRRDESGRFERYETRRMDTAASQLHVMAYHVSGQHLVRADVPLWFLKIKGPAVQYALRGTDFDLAALNVTASELEAAGRCVVIDETRANGDRLLVWTN